MDINKNYPMLSGAFTSNSIISIRIMATRKVNPAATSPLTAHL